MYEQEESLVTIFKTSDEALIAIARSLLEGTDIQYFVKNLTLQGFIYPSAGMMDSGGMEIQVSSKDAESAIELLADLSPEQKHANTARPESDRVVHTWSRFIFLFSAISAGVILYLVITEILNIHF